MSKNNPCSFCLSSDTDREYLASDDGVATICSECAKLFAQYMQQKKQVQKDVTASTDVEHSDKYSQYQEWLTSIEDKWMEKNVINSYILDSGGSLNQVHFRFEDDDDGYYLVCELDVSDIDSLPEDAEENILNEVEWAFDDIREDLEAEGLDLDTYLGEKVVLIQS